jgi:chromate reductase
MKFMLMAAALRQGSFNKKLIAVAAKILQSQGHVLDLADFAEFDVPLYNGDLEQQQGIPSGAQDFAKRMQDAQGIVIASPEYNFSVPGILKNLIDWVSRIDAKPFNKRNMYLLSASPSLVGGNRGLWQLRISLECCGARVYPSMFSLASAHQAFSQEGSLSDTNLSHRLEQELQDFTEFSRRLSA